MANINIREEPGTAPPPPPPPPDRWFNLTLGSSFKDHPTSKYCTLRYEFKPASIDKSQPGRLHKSKDNKVTVDFHNNQPGKPNVQFEGIGGEDYKDNDAVLFFDGETFRLERLHRAVKRLRHRREPGEASTSIGPPPESSSSPAGKATKFPSSNKAPVHQLPADVERIEIGGFKSFDAKPREEKPVHHQSTPPHPSNASPDNKNDDLEEELDILNDDDDDDVEADNRVNTAEKEIFTGIDINMPHQNEMDDEIAEVDISDDEADKGPSAAEALRAQLNAEERKEESSSSSDSSRSGTSSGSGSGSSSSDNEGSDADSITSI